MTEVRREQLYRVDGVGFPIKDSAVIVDFDEEGNLITEVEDDIIEHIIPQKLYRPRWNGSEWIEDMAQEEIDELYKQPIKESSEIDLLNEKFDTQNIILEEILFDILPMIGGIGCE